MFPRKNDRTEDLFLFSFCGLAFIGVDVVESPSFEPAYHWHRLLQFISNLSSLKQCLLLIFVQLLDVVGASVLSSSSKVVESCTTNCICKKHVQFGRVVSIGSVSQAICNVVELSVELVEELLPLISSHEGRVQGVIVPAQKILLLGVIQGLLAVVNGQFAVRILSIALDIQGSFSRCIL